jgi:hypothetical protein
MKKKLEFFQRFFENFFKNIPRIFLKYFPKSNKKKQVGVAHVISFAP